MTAPLLESRRLVRLLASSARGLSIEAVAPIDSAWNRAARALRRFLAWAYTPKDFLRGLAIYAAGDTIATLILGSFSWPRALGMMCVGAFVYSFEIPRYFGWIESRFSTRTGARWRCAKAAAAMAYFNPLWIARHYLFIELFIQLNSGSWIDADYSELVTQALRSFGLLAPLSVLGNYLIQNRLPLRWRFTASALMSGSFAIGYALFHG